MKVLFGLTVVALLAASSQVIAQSQTSVPLYKGEVTAANAEQFTSTLANHVDQVIGLQITFDTINIGDTLTDASPNAGAYISHANSYSGGVQINIPDA